MPSIVHHTGWFRRAGLSRVSGIVLHPELLARIRWSASGAIGGPLLHDLEVRPLLVDGGQGVPPQGVELDLGQELVDLGTFGGFLVGGLPDAVRSHQATRGDDRALPGRGLLVTSRFHRRSWRGGRALTSAEDPALSIIGVLAVSKALQDVAAFLLLLASIAGAIGVLAKFTRIGRPVAWLWRRIVVEPFTAWFRHEVMTVVQTAIKAEVAATVEAQFAKLMQPNGGRSLYDIAKAVHDLGSKLDDHVTGVIPKQ